MNSSRRNFVHLPIFEPGSGKYGDTLGRINRGIVKDSEDLIMSYVDKVQTKGPGVFTVADYGTNDGSVSMSLITKIIHTVRKKRGEDIPIQIVYEDQEKNDFNSLFKRLNNDDSYMSKFSGVFPMATNINFYNQCVPDGTCDLIFSSSALHWMEHGGTPCKECVFYVSPKATPEEVQRHKQAGERDYTKFLTARARELKPGGLLVLISFLEFEEGPGRTTLRDRVSNYDIHHDLEMAWEQLKEESTITPEEFERCDSQLVYRTGKEMKYPFEAANSAVRAAGLKLIYYDEFVSPCAYKPMWRDRQFKDKEEGRRFYADINVLPNRVWVDTIFRNSLSGRSDEEQDTILNRLYEVFRQRISRADPETYASDNFISRLIAQKF